MPDDLDLSEYDQEVVEHALVGRARARMFEGMTKTAAWSVALDLAQLQIGYRTFNAQLLGTYSHQSDTFLWSWANPGAGHWPRQVIDIASELRAWGERPGYAVFREPKIAAGWVKPYELAWVAGELVGGIPIFVGRSGITTAFLAVTGLDDPPDVQLLSPAYIPGVILELHLYIAANPRNCVRTFAHRLGFDLEDDDRSIRARRQDCTFVVTFDDRGRPERVDMETSRSQ